MRGRGLSGLMGAVLALTTLSACGDDLPDYRYKITIYAQGKVYSSVRQIRQREIFSVQDSSGRKVERTLDGQAVIMDLPDGRRAYATLAGKGLPDLAKHLADIALLPKGYQRPKLGNRFEEIAAEQQVIVHTVGAKALPRTVPYGNTERNDYPLQQTWPLFAEFDNPKSWLTIRAVSPEAIGVREITIEITQDPVTKGIEEYLPGPGDNRKFSQWVRSLDFRDDRMQILGAFYDWSDK